MPNSSQNPEDPQDRQAQQNLQGQQEPQGQPNPQGQQDPQGQPNPQGQPDPQGQQNPQGQQPPQDTPKEAPNPLVPQGGQAPKGPQKPQGHKNENVTIVGSGVWGLTLAKLLSEAGKPVTLYTRDRLRADALKKDRKIDAPLKIELPESLEISTDLGKSLNSAAAVVVCVTSQSMRVLCSDFHSHFMTADEGKRPVIVSAVKGLELGSLKRMSEVVEEIIPGARVCSLSGPNLAEEILQGLPAAAVIASHDITTAAFVQNLLSVPKFRIYSNSDILGVELGGTLKNVIAIAAGGSDGLKLGANAKAALLTRGLAEITRLATIMGAQPATLAGLAGMGDLLATCAGPMSRNYRMGMELAQGKKLDDIQKEIGGVVEGLTTATAVCELAQRIGVELPIAELVQKIIAGTIAPDKAIAALLGRPLISE